MLEIDLGISPAEADEIFFHVPIERISDRSSDTKPLNIDPSHWGLHDIRTYFEGLEGSANNHPGKRRILALKKHPSQADK